jgi:hypothetical protein
MATAIDRAGTFRGKPVEWGVSESKNKYPQFVVTLRAAEFFDEEAGQYIPWGEYEQEITGYLVLFTKDNAGQWKELLNVAQIKKALGWDGRSFESLANGQYGETIVLFRVEPNEYNGSTSLKLTWLDAADANPVKTLPKYDVDKLKAMTSAMGGILSASVPTPKPATAKPVSPRKPGRPKSAEGSPATPSTVKPAAPSTATPPPVGAPAPAAPAPSGTPAPATTPTTKDSAWAAVNETRAADVTEDKLAEVWIAVVSTVSSSVGRAEDQFTSTDWYSIQKTVQEKTAKF